MHVRTLQGTLTRVMGIQDAGGWASLRALRALCGKIRNMTEPEEGVGCRRGIYGAARGEWRMAGGQLRTGWEEVGRSGGYYYILNRYRPGVVGLQTSQIFP